MRDPQGRRRCISEIAKQSQKYLLFYLPSVLHISGCSDGTGRQRT
jgi:hypothetical protein